MKKGRSNMITNIPGAIRTVECGNGIYELVKEPDVLCVIPVRKRSWIRKALPWLGLAGIIGGAAVAVIVMAPAFGTLLFATVSGLMFAAMLAGEGQK